MRDMPLSYDARIDQHLWLLSRPISVFVIVLEAMILRKMLEKTMGQVYGALIAHIPLMMMMMMMMQKPQAPWLVTPYSY